ncbi:hypothetical protein TW84_16840 [Vibrio neptunius]|nr:hypothetical protein TW84_16840 [Vibrio neptunius]
MAFECLLVQSRIRIKSEVDLLKATTNEIVLNDQIKLGLTTIQRLTSEGEKTMDYCEPLLLSSNLYESFI